MQPDAVERASSSSEAVDEVVVLRTKPLPARFARASGSTKRTVNLRPSHVVLLLVGVDVNPDGVRALKQLVQDARCDIATAHRDVVEETPDVGVDVIERDDSRSMRGDVSLDLVDGG